MIRYDIEKDHFFIQMPKKTMLFFYDPRDTTWAECAIKPYDFDGYSYKVVAESVEPGFVSQTFYRDDFDDMIENGDIFVKTSENAHVKRIDWEEPLFGKCVVHHSADIVVDN